MPLHDPDLDMSNDRNRHLLVHIDYSLLVLSAFLVSKMEMKGRFVGEVQPERDRKRLSYNTRYGVRFGIIENEKAKEAGTCNIHKQ